MPADQLFSIPYLSEPPSYLSFLRNHLLPNVPVLIGPSLTASWRARREWVVPNLGASESIPQFVPNFGLLKDQFGDAEVKVADCAKREFTDQPRISMRFAEFVEMWEVMGRRGGSDNVTGKEDIYHVDGNESRYYLKDWHFVKAYPDYGAYETPDIFRDDWMNEFWLTRDDLQDDYRFVYMGGHRTFTPFHADVYRSYSWSANICGIKRWTLFPPGQEKLFKDRLGNMVYDVRDVDEVRFPKFREAKKIVVMQKDGETLFVPSGWFHQVENIGHTISINHNWSNACNLPHLFASLSDDLGEVRHTIRDLRPPELSSAEFEQTSQRLLLANSGWDWFVMWRMLECVARRLGKQARAEDEEKYLSLALQPPIGFQAKRIEEVVRGLVGEEGAKGVLIECCEAEEGEKGMGDKRIENFLSEVKRLVEETKNDL